jgi:ubiquinone/menaquinone biosynthesis C-methylase UbiE
MLPMMFKQIVAPALGDLAHRMEQPGARFLDVGVGVGMILVGMCKMFPSLSVVGLDPFDAPLAIAKKNTASFGDRVELRAIGLEDLRDDVGFDAAWVPTFFLPPAKADAGLSRLHAAMKPGGWVVLGTMGGTPTTRLVCDLWGGVVWSPAETEAALARAGFAPRTLPGPAWAPSLVVGQRA